MRILFDNGTPNPIAGSLTGHEVAFARQIGWHELKNGELLRQAEEAGYDVLLTSDKNIRYQQNLSDRRIAIVVLGNQQWPSVRLHLDRIATAIEAATPGSYTEVDIPHKVPLRSSDTRRRLPLAGERASGGPGLAMRNCWMRAYSNRGILC